MSQNLSLYLGPILGFLFTAGTLLFVALNAHRTLPPPEAAVASVAEGPAPAPETPATVVPDAQPEETPREGT
jgi:hypothetical protein